MTQTWSVDGARDADELAVVLAVLPEHVGDATVVYGDLHVQQAVAQQQLRQVEFGHAERVPRLVAAVERVVQGPPTWKTTPHPN